MLKGGKDCKLLTIYFSQAGMVVYPKFILSLPISQSTVIRHHLSRGYCLRLNYSGDVKTRHNPKPGNLVAKPKLRVWVGNSREWVVTGMEGVGCKHSEKFR